MKIPLSKPHFDEVMKDAVMKVIDSGQYILGEQCRLFEEEFAQYVGVKYAVLTSSGTSALFLALKALGIRGGDHIIVPSLTAFPTVEAIYHTGAKPIFVDIDETFTVNMEDLKAIIELLPSKNTRGIIPVHLYGHPANMTAILELSKKYGLFVLEDCCQAHGATDNGRPVGSMGIAGCFSFYPSKNMTVFGDGGMVTTNNQRVAQAVRMLRDHGRKEKYEHELVGYNLRFNEIQAAVGRIQLKYLDAFNGARRQIALWYANNLRGFPVYLWTGKEWAQPVFHLLVIQTKERDKLAEFLKGKGIQTGIHYPVPCHLQPAVLKVSGPQPKLKITEEAVKYILSLPMYPDLIKEEVDYVCESIKEFFGNV